jgi:flagellar basal body rod protein FlgC
MVNLISATRSFEANTQAVSAIKEIAQKSLEIGK